ncbi:MAG: glycosyltransferase [Parvibaculales bacterium]
MNGDKNNPRHLLETGFGENLPSAQLHPTQQDQKLYWASEAIVRFTPYQSAKHAPVLTFLFWFSCLTLITLGLVWFYLDVTFFLLSVICLLFALNECACFILAPLHRKTPKNHDKTTSLAPSDYGRYSVFLPLFHEAHMLEQLVAAMQKLDYPPDKLELIFILEANDQDTHAALLALLAKEKLMMDYQICIVPEAHPQTKPRACNYALLLASGDYCVIYDAEDLPHPQQLNEAATWFAQNPDAKICFQAPLIIKDHKYDLLGSFMALNYTTLFRLQMPILAKADWLIYFGGTSNHLNRRHLLAELGWDAYNMTEDAELSLRLYQRGYKIKMLNHPTYESATYGFINHIKQRTRWQKGTMQTLIAHRHIWGFKKPTIKQIYILLSLLGRSLSPALFAFLILSNLTLIYKETFTPSLPNLISLLPYVLLVMLNLLACFKNKTYWLIFLVPLIPLQWFFLCMTFIRALWQLLRRPFYWEKSPHHLTQIKL